MWRNRLQDEAGVALVYVLLASVIISGLVVVFMQRSLFEIRSTANAASWESAIHVAEAGAEALFGQINREGDEFEDKVVTEGPDKDGSWKLHVYDPHPDWTDSDLRAYERRWAEELARYAWADEGQGIIETDDGYAYGIRPIKPNGDEVWDIVFGVGFVPDFGPNATVRVVKMQINQYFFRPDHALLVGGSVHFSGNAASILSRDCHPQDEPDNCDADVHANGNVTRSGNSKSDIKVEGTISATGTTDADSVFGPAKPGESPITIPEYSARDFYGRDHVTEPHWYDLCPDGNVYLRGAAPCAGKLEWSSGGPKTDFRGWDFKKASGEWTAPAVQSGVYYVYGTDATITGSNGQARVTVLVEADPAAPSESGSLSVSGNPNLRPAIDGVLFVTDSDLKMAGTPSGSSWEISGFIFVGEQFEGTGNTTLNGAIIVADRTDHHWLVRRSNSNNHAGAEISGNLTLNYNRDLVLNLSGRITIEYWNEL